MEAVRDGTFGRAAWSSERTGLAQSLVARHAQPHRDQHGRHHEPQDQRPDDVLRSLASLAIVEPARDRRLASRALGRKRCGRGDGSLEHGIGKGRCGVDHFVPLLMPLLASSRDVTDVALRAVGRAVHPNHLRRLVSLLLPAEVTLMAPRLPGELRIFVGVRHVSLSFHRPPSGFDPEYTVQSFSVIG